MHCTPVVENIIWLPEASSHISGSARTLRPTAVVSTAESTTVPRVCVQRRSVCTLAHQPASPLQREADVRVAHGKQPPCSACIEALHVIFWWSPSTHFGDGPLQGWRFVLHNCQYTLEIRDFSIRLEDARFLPGDTRRAFESTVRNKQTSNVLEDSATVDHRLALCYGPYSKTNRSLQ